MSTLMTSEVDEFVVEATPHKTTVEDGDVFRDLWAEHDVMVITVKTTMGPMRCLFVRCEGNSNLMMVGTATEGYLLDVTHFRFSRSDRKSKEWPLWLQNLGEIFR